ncbi:hypothetical protein VNO77_31122 [Canavalia gladiata]|uniref:Uncharacterized protein n=1 Tax=Canavalia gladiata TaxID=3824 RepID=A0AAN9KQS4_CANGL
MAKALGSKFASRSSRIGRAHLDQETSLVNGYVKKTEVLFHQFIVCYYALGSMIHLPITMRRLSPREPSMLRLSKAAFALGRSTTYRLVASYTLTPPFDAQGHHGLHQAKTQKVATEEPYAH